MNNKAYTFLELALVLIIIGILAAFGIEKLYLAVEYSRSAEAFAIISSVRSGFERCYLLNDGSYVGCGDSNEVIQIKNVTPSHFWYRDYLEEELFVIYALRNQVDCKETLGCFDNQIWFMHDSNRRRVATCGKGIWENLGECLWDGVPSPKPFE